MINLKLSVSRSASIPAAFVGVTVRLFFDLALDGGTIHNGAWIAALLGALPSIPYLLCLDAVRSNRSAATPLRLMLLSVTALDAAHVLTIVVRAAGCLTLEYVPARYLALPLALAVLWCVWRNGDAVGYAAILWIRVFPALLLLVVALQMRHYNAQWLLPLFGNGFRDIIRGAARTPGWFVPATAIYFSADRSDDDYGGRPSIARLFFAPVVAALLLVLRLMMVPTGLYGLTWIARLDALLTNGRAALYLQLPMILAFFISAFHLLTCECFAASALLQRLMPALDGRLCAAIVTIACTGMCMSGITAIAVEFTAPWLFIVVGMTVALSALLQRDRKGGERPCGG